MTDGGYRQQNVCFWCSMIFGLAMVSLSRDVVSNLKQLTGW